MKSGLLMTLESKLASAPPKGELKNALSEMAALMDWIRHEEVRIAVCKYLNGGVDAPQGWTRPEHPLFQAVAEWWKDERARLNAILS